MRGLTKEERHQWHGQPGHWTCKRCFARMEGGGPTDGICPASMGGRFDYSGVCRCGECPACLRRREAAARSARLDTPERVRKDLQPTLPYQPLSGSTGKGRQVTTEQGDKR